MTSVVIVDGGGNILEYVAGDEEAQQVTFALQTQNVYSYLIENHKYMSSVNKRKHSFEISVNSLSVKGISV